jgi:hypothetical protein
MIYVRIVATATVAIVRPISLITLTALIDLNAYGYVEERSLYVFEVLDVLRWTILRFNEADTEGRV